MHDRVKVFAATVLLVLSAGASAAEAKLGLSVQVDGDGFFLNPVVNKVIVTSVEPRSLAGTAGIVKGDEIVSVDGHLVKGNRASELKPCISFKAGETRTFGMKRANGETFEARITKPME